MIDEEHSAEPTDQVTRQPDQSSPDTAMASVAGTDGARRRVVVLVGVAALVAGGVWGVTSVSGRSEDPAPLVGAVLAPPDSDAADDEPVTTEPALSAPTAERAEPSTPVTVPEIVSTRLIDITALGEFAGRWDLAPRNATLEFGQAGPASYMVEVTERSFCVVISGGAGGGCVRVEDPAIEFKGPESIFYGISVNKVEGWWSTDFVIPSGVELSLSADGETPCELQPFPLEQVGDAVLWACSQYGELPERLELTATRGTDSVVAPLASPRHQSE